MAARGYCTMNPEMGRWLALCEGGEDKGPAWKPIISLKNMVRKLFPEEEADSLLAEHHEAGADANMARLVYLTLADRVKAARPGA